MKGSFEPSSLKGSLIESEADRGKADRGSDNASGNRDKESLVEIEAEDRNKESLIESEASRDYFGNTEADYFFSHGDDNYYGDVDYYAAYEQQMGFGLGEERLYRDSLADEEHLYGGSLVDEERLYEDSLVESHDHGLSNNWSVVGASDDGEDCFPGTSAAAESYIVKVVRDKKAQQKN